MASSRRGSSTYRPQESEHGRATTTTAPWTLSPTTTGCPTTRRERMHRYGNAPGARSADGWPDSAARSADTSAMAREAGAPPKNSASSSGAADASSAVIESRRDSPRRRPTNTTRYSGSSIPTSRHGHKRNGRGLRCARRRSERWTSSAQDAIERAPRNTSSGTAMAPPGGDRDRGQWHRACPRNSVRRARLSWNKGNAHYRTTSRTSCAINDASSTRQGKKTKATNSSQAAHAACSGNHTRGGSPHKRPSQSGRGIRGKSSTRKPVPASTSPRRTRQKLRHRREQPRRRPSPKHGAHGRPCSTRGTAVQVRWWSSPKRRRRPGPGPPPCRAGSRSSRPPTPNDQSDNGRWNEATRNGSQPPPGPRPARARRPSRHGLARSRNTRKHGKATRKGPERQRKRTHARRQKGSDPARGRSASSALSHPRGRTGDDTWYRRWNSRSRNAVTHKRCPRTWPPPRLTTRIKTRG